MVKIAYIALGSNLNNPQQQLESALSAIAQLPKTSLISTSSFYSSTPQGPDDQPNFLNAVCKISTTLIPIELLAALQNIERKQGKQKIRHWGERCIDLDILLYNQEIINLPQLQVPHPHMLERDFVLIPLAQIEPDLRLNHDIPIQEIINQLTLKFV